MNKGLIKAMVLALMVALIGLAGCGGGSPEKKSKEGKLEKMKPKAEDRLSKLMDRSWDNLEYMMYGFMSYDSEKIKVATANITAVSPYMAQRIGPQYYQYIDEWREQCNRQQQIAGKLRRQFEEKNFVEARESLNEMIEVCMDCHKVYRRHLLTPTWED